MPKSTQHPNHDGKLRLNLMAILFNKARKILVCDLIPRENDLRPCQSSFVGGGFEDRHKTPLDGIFEETKEEVGLTREDVTPVVCATAPIFEYFQDWDTSLKYIGKLHLLHFMSVNDNAQINLNGQHDEEGSTFNACDWKTIDDAKAYLLARSLTKQHKLFINRVFDLITPVAQAMQQIGISPEKLTTSLNPKVYSTTMPTEYPIPERGDKVWALPTPKL